MIEDNLLDDNEVYQVRKHKLEQLRHNGFNFPNTFRRLDLANDLINKYSHLDKEELVSKNITVAIAGRIMLRRIMGKASFVHIQDVSARIQVYIRQNDLSQDSYEQFKHWDLGDIIGVKGSLFKTNTQEFSVHALELTLLTKSLRPLPDKFHGLTDQELRYRKRYIDLIANEDSRNIFMLRSKLIKAFRQFMDSQQFLEVETPMMHPIPGGAVARPFITHHNTLDMQMFLRVAPELYLKRLVVGGFERVYELNRNFRNEGISTRHNPEFTMAEFYQAYATYSDLMDFTETLICYLCDEVLGRRQIEYQTELLNLTPPFTRMSLQEAILAYHQSLSQNDLENTNKVRAYLDHLKITYDANDILSKLQTLLFETTVEHLLIQPTFITAYPIEVSPLARQNDNDPHLADRFELFIAGREIANGFSELNDAKEQAARFKKQVIEKDAGNLEAMHFDHAYIEALEYGMPPTAGTGIGIDRLVMLFTNAASIRDVILFPHLRPND